MRARQTYKDRQTERLRERERERERLNRLGAQRPRDSRESETYRQTERLCRRE